MATHKDLTILQQQPKKIWSFYSRISQRSDHFTVATHFRDLRFDYITAATKIQGLRSNHIIKVATHQDLFILQQQLTNIWPF